MLYYIYSSKRFKLAHHGTIQRASQQDYQSQEKITFIYVLFFFYLSPPFWTLPIHAIERGSQLYKQLIKRKQTTKTRQCIELYKP
ncbi:hypothetical protein GmHk_14G041038 [Glycine max]|nr:hypothetical protein GmHk_14G041038 [Glycine max]